jgi:hypothetical protein
MFFGPEGNSIMSKSIPMILPLWFSAILFALPLSGSEFCAVKVRVIDPVGELVSVPVDLVGSDGRVIESTRTVNGEAEFCDFGFGEHTIRVAEGQCGFVTLNRIRLVYAIAQRFDVILNPCFIGAETMRYPPSCLVYIRVSSDNGKKLINAEAVVQGNKRTYHTDIYGRLFLAAPNGASTVFEIRAAGYIDKTVPISCQSYETVEKSVQLTPK